MIFHVFSIFSSFCIIAFLDNSVSLKVNHDLFSTMKLRESFLSYSTRKVHKQNKNLVIKQSKRFGVPEFITIVQVIFIAG